VSDPGPRDLPVGAKPGGRRKGLGAVLRSVALALLASLLFGFAVGLWLRCRLERPDAPYLGGPTAPNPAVATQSRVAP
jgi:hypothetical protein